MRRIVAADDSPMRQILLNDRGAIVARMPRPSVDRGSVLVRVRYSLVSTGTELSGLRKSADPADRPGLSVRARTSAGLARHYLRAALAEPDRAARRAVGLARNRLAALRPAPPERPTMTAADLVWTRHAATTCEPSGQGIRLVTDASPGAYQASAGPIQVDAGMVPVITVHGRVESGAVTMGLLNETGDQWLGSRIYEAGTFEDQLIFDPAGSRTVSLVIAGGGRDESAVVTLDRIDVSLRPPLADGLPQTELDQQGWNVGYSAAGEVIAVGEGIQDLVPGDLVACAGAGVANHADYIVVQRNLVCRVPEGCSLEVAATTTVGAIALQGVRRARPQLGERIAVIGLGLIGQITVQLLRAAGCGSSGSTSTPLASTGRAGRGWMRARRSRRRSNGWFAMRPGAAAPIARSSPQRPSPATSSTWRWTSPVRKARWSIVGDVGLNVEREVFYRKEIDLLMSTSYGPGRYDADYEARGHDYPFGYVRWTLNRNMQAYMEAAADKRIDVECADRQRHRRRPGARGLPAAGDPRPAHRSPC